MTGTLSVPVARFGTRRDGAQELAHITPVPQATLSWLRAQVIAALEDGQGPDAELRDAVRRSLTARLLSAEWARLLSGTGLPLSLACRRQRHPVRLRVGLTALGPSVQQLDPLPDGPPVSVQRWAFGTDEAGDTGGSGDVRGIAHPFSHTWAANKGPLRSVTLTSQPNLTYNQLTTAVAIGTTVQPMVLIRSKGRHWPFDYAMAWELRRGPGPLGTPAGMPPDGEWRPLSGSPPEPLRVWFPAYLADAAEELPLADTARPETVPAPLDRLLDEVPLFGPKALADHDILFEDVMNAFAAPFASLSDASRKALSEFLSEGNLRSNLPQAWEGTVASPTLTTDADEILGHLRISAKLVGGGTPTGPTTASSVLETYVLRSLRMQGSAQISNGAGLRLSVSFGLGPRLTDSGATPLGGQLGVQFGAQHHFAHQLNSGGSARTAHSLRTALPLFHVTPRMRLHVTLVRPDDAPLPPAAGSRLARGAGYSIDMLVPSVDALGHPPSVTRYLPPELLHLQHLGVSSTPLQVSGTEPLFHRAEQWLRDNGFLPADQPRTGPRSWHGTTDQATHVQRLNNLRKLEQMRSRLGLRSALDEMIEGGTTVWFEVPGALGTRRVSLRMVAERRYPDAHANAGIEHQRTLPGVQTLNYTGSTTPGEERFHSTAFAWDAGVDGSVTGLSASRGDQPLQQIRADWSYSSQTTTTTGSGVGTGQEHYLLSPTETGIQTFSVPVTYRMYISDSHGPALAPTHQDGSVRLAVPTFRTLDTPSAAPRPGPARTRDRRHQDDSALALPRPGRTVDEGVLLLPETALLDRVAGSAALRREVRWMAEGLAREAAEEAERYVMPPTPGGWSEGAAQSPEVDSGRPGDAPAARASASSDATAAARTWLPSLPSPLSDVVSAGAGWAANRLTGAGRWVWQTALGEPATAPESLANEVLDAALSPHHLTAHALRVFRDSYVVENAGTPGVLAGTDFTVDVTGYLTDVQVLPRPPRLDAERWLQSTVASAATLSRQSGRQGGLSLTGRYGDADAGFAPQGGFAVRDTSTVATVVDDNTGVFRVTTEDTTPVHRFTATAHYVVTVRRGARNAVSGTVAPGPGLSRSRVVEIPEGVEFLLVDNDLHRHPDLAVLVAASGQSPPSVSASDRRPPRWYVDSGGILGAGAVTEVRSDGGRGSFQRRVHRLVQQEAPGVTTPGHAAYVPGVLTRISEHAGSHGLRTLVNAGPAGHTAFHFVHRSWLGPRLVEVALVARPVPGLDLSSLRGRRVSTTSGLDNVFGHSHGDGTAFGAPGITRTYTTRTRSGRADFSPLGERAGERARPTVGLARQSSRVHAQNSIRELRSWQRTFGGTAEFSVPYGYEVRVSSRALTESLFGRLTEMIGTGWHMIRTVFAMTGGQAASLPAASTGRQEVQPATVLLRFNASETPDEGERRAESVDPIVLTQDPTLPQPAPPSAGTAVEMEIPQSLRVLLSGARWVPVRPFEIYHFAGVRELGVALRAVSGSSERTVTPRTTVSAESVFIRLTTLIQYAEPTRLDPAAVAPFIGRPGTAAVSVQVSLYAPRSEVAGKDTAIDRIELSADGFQSQAETTVTPSVTYSHSSRYGPADRGGPTVPVAGDLAMLGQNFTTSSQRRELLRFGTPFVNAAGEGLLGHRIRAVAVIELHGPGGSRWVAADVLMRTTETPVAVDADGPGPGSLRSVVPRHVGADEEDLTRGLTGTPLSHAGERGLHYAWDDQVPEAMRRLAETLRSSDARPDPRAWQRQVGRAAAGLAEVMGDRIRAELDSEGMRPARGATYTTTDGPCFVALEPPAEGDLLASVVLAQALADILNHRVHVGRRGQAVRNMMRICPNVPGD
ncbi:hypothetical protein ABZT06_42445 [Streptomyces sp. NPDC005483]|uniref:hypothetical protein n=1 Tax=Streptomyces sp. NPDC005483 TaxID=3154882 RepID=UPI0033A747C3